jgi:hypothetical protein
LPSQYAPEADARFHSPQPVDGVPMKVCVRSCTNRKVCRHLLCFFSRLVKLSCDERPEGSLLAFAPSDVVACAYRFRNSTHICSIAKQRSLALSSFTRTTIVSLTAYLPSRE